MRRTITLGMALWMGLGTQAWAHVVDHAFKDVPPAHWAADSRAPASRDNLVAIMVVGHVREMLATPRRMQNTPIHRCSDTGS